MLTLHAWRNLLLALFAIGLLSGCAGPQGDPLEKLNRGFYDINDGLDHYLLTPLSDGYTKVVPKEVRTCLSNAFDNLGYPYVILNDFLQAKWDQGWSDSGRMAVNSTLGIAGLFDVAGPWNMPAHDNDFGITLGQWGVPAGPYVVIPLFGPSCARDVPGIGVQILTNPLTWVGVPLLATIMLGTTQALDTRSRADTALRFRDQAAIDPYVFTRSAYLQYREGQIHPGQPPKTDAGMYDDVDDVPTTTPSTAPSTTPTTAPAPQSSPTSSPATTAAH